MKILGNLYHFRDLHFGDKYLIMPHFYLINLSTLSIVLSLSVDRVKGTLYSETILQSHPHLTYTAPAL